MPISANAVWNIMSSATGTAGKNGGFFVTGASGTDYSLQDGAQYALTGVTSVGAGNTILSSSASSDMVGNGLFVVSGTNFTSNAWFEITSVVVGVSITVSTNAAGTAICTGVGASGVVNIGGANHLNSTLADDMFEAGAAGNTYYIMSGTYTLGESLNFTRDGTTTLPMKIKGYISSQGDSCEGSSRPTLNFGTFSCILGSYWWMSNIFVTGTPATLLTMGISTKMFNCKVINKSSTASRVALATNTNFLIHSCELSSYLGTALSSSSDAGSVVGCYIHSSSIGVLSGTTSAHVSLINNLLIDLTYGIYISSATSAAIVISGNTFCSPVRSSHAVLSYYGVYIAAGLATGVIIVNNIFTDMDYGVYSASGAGMSYDLYNNYYNNSTDVTVWVKGPSSTSAIPTFAGVGSVSGSTATTTSGNHLVQSGATFITSGVVAGRDYVYVASGTGVTPMFYGILSVDSETQITTDVTLAANATADKVFGITFGRNFAVGTPMKALGGPRPTALASTYSYFEQGASQRRDKGTTVSAFIG
jgi:hypothetical protein